MQKAVSLYESAVQRNNELSYFNLARLYSQGKGVKADYERAALYFLHSSKLEKAQLQLKILLKDRNIDWRIEFHSYWPKLEKKGNKNDFLRMSDQIKAVLFVSKYRNTSTLSYTKYIVKGVAINIIRFLSVIWRDETISSSQR